jgi:hypothetical protein
VGVEQGFLLPDFKICIRLHSASLALIKGHYALNLLGVSGEPHLSSLSRLELTV